MGKDMVDGEWKDFPDNKGPRPMFSVDGQVPRKRSRSQEFKIGDMIKQQVYDHEFKGIVGMDGQDYV